MRKFILSLGLIVSAAAVSAQQEPKVVCSLSWQIIENGVMRDSAQSGSKELAVSTFDNIPVVMRFHGFNFSGRITPIDLSWQPAGYELNMGLLHGGSVAALDAPLQPDQVKEESLALLVGKGGEESVVAICKISAK